MQYVWQHRLWPKSHLHTVDGRPVHVIDPGKLNLDSGPDFFNAKVSIDGHTWAGDVEIHVRASDWHRHGHHTDPAYNSVILHVVDRDDTLITRANGETIPQMQMACTPDFSARYSALVDRADRSLPCAATLSEMQPLYLTDWMQALAFERLHDKADRIFALLERLQSDWESVAYVTLSRCLGFSVNSEPFERLALSMPLRFIGKHRDSLLTIEAILFGQSGLLEQAASLPGASSDHYLQRLFQEYAFIAHKFGLRRPESLGWKLARMRPPNFPQRRIATLAAILHSTPRILPRCLEIESLDSAAEFFQTPFSGYWADRFSFGPPSPQTPLSLSRSSVASLVINAVVPLQFAYADAHSDNSLADRALALLQSLPPERNSIVELFRSVGLNPRDAFHTQSLIQLRRQYCEQRKCLYCRIGHRMLAARTPRF